MMSGVRVKICGLTSLVDAEQADAVGADFLGFIFHPSSPRKISLLQWKAMAPRLPDRKRVAVSVMPTNADLQALLEAGFDCFQVHFPPGTSQEIVAGWSAVVGRERLWLAPKLPPAAEFPSWIFEYTDTVLVDTYAADAFGGTGKTGDWDGFRRLREAHPETRWILAGGLSPQNIAEALAATGARVIDLSSGVEAVPGVKDPAKLRALALAVHRARESVQAPPSPTA